MALVCDAILKNRFIKGSTNVMDRSCLRKVTILPSLMVIDTVVVET